MSKFLSAENVVMKKKISATEKILIQQTFEEISRLDQLYRKVLSTGTTDEKILHAIDFVFDNEGIKILKEPQLYGMNDTFLMQKRKAFYHQKLKTLKKQTQRELQLVYQF
jgi:hypothetical protein